MAQHGNAGWTIGPVGSDMDGANTGGDDGGFVGQVDHDASSYLDAPTSHENHFDHVGYAPSANHYGQQGHGQYSTQHPYSDLGFGLENQPAFPHDIQSLGPAQVAGHSHSNEFQQQNVPYSNSQNLSFQPYHQDMRGHYPGFAPSQQHVGLNDFQRNSWAEAHAHHRPSGPYAQGQQLYGDNSSLQMPAAQPAQPSAPQPEQSQPSYQVNHLSAYQPQTYSGTYHTPQSTEVRQSYPNHLAHSAAVAPGKSNTALTQSPGPVAAASHSVSWPSQGQAQRLGAASVAPASTRVTPPSVSRPPTTESIRAGSKLGASSTNATCGDAVAFVYRAGNPGEEWKSLKGCPNFLFGAAPVRRQLVAATPGVKPHVANYNRNGTRLLPLLPDRLPCEVLREKYQAIEEELKRVGEDNEKTKELINGALVGSEAHQRYGDELKKLESQKASLEGEKKKLTGKAAALKVEKVRATGKLEAAVYESESLTESSEEEDPQELAVQQIMASKRSSDPEGGALYDVVQILRREESTGQTATSQNEKEDHRSKVIGRRVADFGKYVVDLCAEAKTLREQKSTAPKSQAPQLQATIDQKYGLVRVALDTALDYYDEETLRNTGQHMKLMSSLTIALNRQFASKSYNTDLSLSILRFFSKATLMDMDIFQKVKLSTVLEKHGDNLNERGKQLVLQISKNAEERTAKNAAEKPAVSSQLKPKLSDNAKEGETKSISKTTSALTKDIRPTEKLQAPQLGNKTVPEAARKETKTYSGLVSARKMANNTEKAAARGSPSKRQRDDETDSRAAKKVAVESSTGAPGAARTATGSGSNLTAPSSSASNNGQPRPRPAGSTVLNKLRTASKPPAKKAESQPSISSTISGLLAEIAKPAEKPKPQERPVKVPETPEERKRRLRKEERRGRTVTWKPDDELVQIRFFEHDSTEDEGRASNMIRDARDNRQEGQMLKQMQRSMQEGDDEDDDGNPTETDIRPWVKPQSIDYSALDKGQREKNYVTRGGVRDVNSEQKKVMEEYENRELMSIYTTRSEIPESPRSPARMTSEAFTTKPKQVGLPANDQKKQEAHLRWSESRQYGTTAALQYALRRLGHSSNHVASSTSASVNTGPKTTSSQGTTAGHMMTQEERDARVLALLQSDRARNYVDPTPYDPTKATRALSPPESRDEEVQKAFSIIANAVDQCRNLPTQPVVQPQALQPAAAHAQSQHVAPQTSHFAAYQTQAQAQPQAQQHPQGYPQLAPQVPDQYAAILQQVKALQNPQAAQAAQAATVPQPAPAQPDNGLANLLATLRHSTQPTQAPAQDPNLAAWQAWAQNQAQAYSAQARAQSQSQGQAYSSYSQQYDSTTHDEPAYGSHKQEYDSQGQYHRDGGERGNRNKELNRGTKDHKGINRALIGTKPCSFWAKGQCAKGDSCTFRHDPNDLK